VRGGAALFAVFAVALGCAPPGQATPGRIAVGLEAGVPPDAAAALIESVTGGAVDHGLEALDALIVSVADRDVALEALQALPGIEYVEPVTQSRSLAFLPNDPLTHFQWYLDSIQAFSYWETRPGLPIVTVAVVDSGIDAGHPEFAGTRIRDLESFVGSPASVDSLGHGTIVAGEIAAAIDNADGIAGVGFPVELLIAKVVAPGGGVSVEAEAKAIRWAVDHGADVINLSLGGVRDPTNAARDTYSSLEHAAIEYAYRKGVVIVAVTGNCEDVCPYRYASYPAALAHVIGVSALTVAHEVPAFSNRDPVFNDLAAPGAGIVSTFPRTPSLNDPACEFPGYSVCAEGSLKSGNGTSFAAPLVSAAAALLIAQDQRLVRKPSQVIALLERSATDLAPAGRDVVSGNGLLNVAGALAMREGALPPADRFETNDDAGSRAYTLRASRRTIAATIDYFDDPSDVYRVYLRSGQRLGLALKGPGGRSTLVVWRPGTEEVTDVTALAVRSGAILGFRRGASPRLTLPARRTGWHYVEVKAPFRSGGAYELAITRSR
jgi:subtilisin family serine protease